MEHTNLCFDAEYPNIGSFELFVQESLKQHQLDGLHTVDCIIKQAYDRCQNQSQNQAAELTESVVQIEMALLKTNCLEIISKLSQVRNRRKFDQAVQALFDDNNPDALPFCASIARTLRQFRLSGTYEAKDVISEAYTRGVKQIESGRLIDVPLAWLRTTSLRVIQELKRKQLRSDNPRFDRDACVAEDVAFSDLEFQEDMQTLQQAIRQLSRADQQLLCARIFRQMSWQEIGESLSHPDEPPLRPGTARQRGARALKKLRQHYDAIRDAVSLPNADKS